MTANNLERKLDELYNEVKAIYKQYDFSDELIEKLITDDRKRMELLIKMLEEVERKPSFSTYCEAVKPLFNHLANYQSVYNQLGCSEEQIKILRTEIPPLLKKLSLVNEVNERYNAMAKSMTNFKEDDLSLAVSLNREIVKGYEMLPYKNQEEYVLLNSAKNNLNKLESLEAYLQEVNDPESYENRVMSMRLRELEKQVSALNKSFHELKLSESKIDAKRESLAPQSDVKVSHKNIFVEQASSQQSKTESASQRQNAAPSNRLG